MAIATGIWKASGWPVLGTSCAGDAADELGTDFQNLTLAPQLPGWTSSWCSGRADARVRVIAWATGQSGGCPGPSRGGHLSPLPIPDYPLLC